MQSEVIKMKELKSWPFEPTENVVTPLGDGFGAPSCPKPG